MTERAEGSDRDERREQARQRYRRQARTPMTVRLALAQSSEDVVVQSLSRLVDFAIDYRFPISLYMALRMRKRYKRKIKALKRA